MIYTVIKKKHCYKVKFYIEGFKHDLQKTIESYSKLTPEKIQEIIAKEWFKPQNDVIITSVLEGSQD